MDVEAYDRAEDVMSLVRGVRDIVVTGAFDHFDDNRDAGFVVATALSAAEGAMAKVVADIGAELRKES